MLHMNDDTTCVLQVEKEDSVKNIIEIQDNLWHMYFDGSSCKEGEEVGIVLISLGGEIISLMYKL